MDADRVAVVSDSWALILAGGDGMRLRNLTRLIAGEPIPKQYCRIMSGRSLLEATLDRVRPLVPPERTVVIINRDHVALAMPQLQALPSQNVLVQPSNRDTGPGIVWSLLKIQGRHSKARIVMFPSDHYVGDDERFRAYIRRASDAIAARPDELALLGIEPDHPSPDYGYVVPGPPLAGADALHRVIAFREKPTLALARRLIRDGGLWNSFVMAYRTDRVLALVARERPAAYRALTGAVDDPVKLEQYYAETEPWNFSADFLTQIARHLIVVPARHTGWSDWGRSARSSGRSRS